jgi:hypothetical protein
VAVVSRGSDGLCLEPPAGWGAAWLVNDVPAHRFLSVAWLKRGANGIRPCNKPYPPRSPCVLGGASGLQGELKPAG